jgi:hypothetical protein
MGGEIEEKVRKKNEKNHRKIALKKKEKRLTE